MYYDNSGNLQFDNTFHLEMIGEEGDTQLNLKWVNLDEKRNREDYCEVSKTKELRKRVVGLVEKLVGGKKVEIVIEVGKYVGEIEKLIPNGQGTYAFPDGKSMFVNGRTVLQGCRYIH